MFRRSSVLYAVERLATRSRYTPKGCVRRFGDDQRGAVAMTFGLMTVSLMMFVGAAIDFGRWMNVRSQTRAAIDTAVLAGARALQVNHEDIEAALATARSFYAANIETRSPVLDDTIDFEIVDGGKALQASGNAHVGTPFLSVASIESLPVLSSSGAESSRATFVLGGGEESKVELSIMLDTTGSMDGQKIADLKTAANDLIDIVLPENSGDRQVRVALAPFAESVRPGAAYLNLVRGTRPSTYSFKDSRGRTQTYKISECVSGRATSAAFTDAAPFGYDALGPVYTKSGSCTTSSEIVPLTTDKAKLKSAVNGLLASGSTAGHLGTAWSWYMLSPKWASLWSNDSRPASYDDTSVKKIAILFTDGEYNTEYDAHGLSTSVNGSGPAVNGSSNSQARSLCGKMKEDGIEIYTVGFALNQNSAIETLRQCASDPGKAYLAADGDGLKTAFRDIAIRLSPLHLTN